MRGEAVPLATTHIEIDEVQPLSLSECPRQRQRHHGYYTVSPRVLRSI